jgi:hypothetical protein
MKVINSTIKMLAFSSRLIKFVNKKIASSKLKLNISEAPFVEISGVGCSGYFDPTKGLFVATGKSVAQWTPVLAHEFCHFLQWKESSKVWKDITFTVDKRTYDSTTVIDEWLGGKDFSKEVLDKAFDAVMKLELDCERRTVNLLRKLKAPINIKEYIQKANSYVLFYRECRKTRQWYDPLSPPYEQKQIWSKMPSTFRFKIEDIVYPQIKKASK